MNKNHLNVSSVESYLYSIIDNVVSNNTFVGSPPETLSDAWTDVCVIDASSAISDREAYGKGVVLIWLYARPMSNGVKNVAKMMDMETKLNEAIAAANDNIYRISRRNTFADYDTVRKWHCNIVELNLIIK